MGYLLNPGASIGNGRKTVTTAGTAEKLSATTVKIRSLIVTAETDNTGVITVGGSTVVGALATRQGTPLSAGQSISLDINDVAKVYIDTTVNGDGVTYSYLGVP